MKGIVLAGGSGTRLYPTTQVISKQLLPIGDKPMIYYPLATLLEGGIREVLVISTPHDLPSYRELLGDGSEYGMQLSYLEQPTPGGLAEAFILAEDYIAKEPVCLILGDNVFYGESLINEVRQASTLQKGGVIFGCRVHDPERYGVVEFDANGKVLSIEEKPSKPKSDYAIPGLYFFDGEVSSAAHAAERSERGELEITEVHNFYLKKGDLTVKPLSRGVAWLDTGTYESMLEASNFIMTLQKRQGLQIGCLEEIAFTQGYISKEQVLERAHKIGKTTYGRYLRDLVTGA